MFPIAIQLLLPSPFSLLPAWYTLTQHLCMSSSTACIISWSLQALAWICKTKALNFIFSSARYAWKIGRPTFKYMRCLLCQPSTEQLLGAQGRGDLGAEAWAKKPCAIHCFYTIHAKLWAIKTYTPGTCHCKGKGDLFFLPLSSHGKSPRCVTVVVLLS